MVEGWLALGVSVLGAVVTFSTIIINWRKIRADHDDKIRRDTLIDERMSKMQSSLDASHNKIRVLEGEMAERNTLFAQLQLQIAHISEIMGRIEAKVDRHLEIDSAGRK